jgi:hypothetical protein
MCDWSAKRDWSAKGEQTRRVIAEAAMRLFLENGYEATTMRAIAKEAGVATGNAYYYFDSKEELIQEYYARNQASCCTGCTMPRPGARGPTGSSTRRRRSRNA